MDLTSLYTKSLDCTNIEHVSFAIKSAYGLGQLSSKLDYVKANNFFFASNKGNLLFECMFNEKFELFNITPEGYDKLMESYQ